jgi:class 3 adenylate cyclase
MSFSKKDEIEIKKVYETFIAGYFSGDKKISSSVPDDFISISGNAELRNRQIKIDFNGSLALINEKSELYAKSENEWKFISEIRISSSLQKVNEEWKFLLQHCSAQDVNAGNENDFTLEKITAENKELRESLRKNTAELECKNRLIEIENALERVRAVAMSMMKPDDLLKVSESVFNELIHLGFSGMRNTQINIYDDDKITYLNYAYSDYAGPELIEVPVKGNSKLISFNEKIRKTSESFADLVFTGDELTEWKNYMYSHGKKKDVKLEKANLLVYYFYSIGKGALGISAFKSVESEQLDILKRFRNVFDLAYKRYCDIALAVEQAKEARIEVALERVRTRSMAMHCSDELVEASDVFFNQLTSLGIEVIRTGVTIFDKENKSLEIWSRTYTNEKPESKILGIVPVKSHEFFEKCFDAWINKEKFFAYEIKGEGVKQYYDSMISILSYPETKIFNPREYFYISFFPEGSLNVVRHDPLSEEEIKLLQRFAKVFGLIYRRFLDLQKAEAQTREANIEAALERVRSKTMGMQESNELKDVIQVVYEQFVHLNIHIEHTGFIMDYKNRDDMHIWIADKREIPSEITFPYFDSPHWNSFLDAKEKGLNFFANRLSFEEKNKFYTDLFELLPELTEETKEYYFNCPGLAISTVLLENVGLYIENFSGIPYSDEDNNTLLRFGKVFQQTYTRFLDLQKAEEQAREAKIEAALERVRSRTMAMHKSDELSEAASLLFQQIKNLGLKTGSCGYNIYENENPENSAKVWMSSPDGDFQPPFIMPHNDSPIYKKIYEAKLQGEDFFEFEAAGDLLRNHFQYLLTIPVIKDIIQKYVDEDYAFPEKMNYNIAFFKHGYLSFHTTEPCPEFADIFKRFGKVFEQTYTRFLDLQKAEEQAREAQVEASLEKVRGRAMAMHNSGDLSEAAGTVFTELNRLGINPIRSGFVLLTKKSRRAKLYPATSFDNKNTSSFTGEFDFTGHPVYEKQYDSWMKKENYFPVLEGEELISYYRILSEGLSVPLKNFPLDKNQFGSFLPFSEGFLFTWSEEPYSESEIKILERFKIILDLTIRRYIDLKTSEAQTRESHIEAAMERVRSRALAMQEPEELKEVVQVLRLEMGLLGVEELETCSIYVKDENNHKAECWYAIKDIRQDEKKLFTDQITFDLKSTIVGRKMLEFYDSDEKQISIEMKGVARKEWIKYCEDNSLTFKGYYGEEIPDRTYHLYKFSHGAIGVATPGDITDESRKLLKRAASAFSLAYSRFKDLSQARFDLQLLKDEKKRSDSLLLNILPEEIANELKQFGKSYARKHEQVSLLFTDIKGFSMIAESLTAEELVAQLDECFRAFDKIVDKHGLEKIKTIGDSYICACGLPVPVQDNALKIVKAAMDMLDFAKGFGMIKKIQDLPVFDFRFGIHTGPVVTGVVGQKKFTYDIWGDTVNMAARMEQHGEAGKINISGDTYNLVKDKFICKYRGKIEAKNKGELDMYFVEGVL